MACPPTRRDVLAAALSAIAAGCGGATAKPTASTSDEPPTKVGELTDVLPLAGLRWLILARPREIAEIPWMIPPIALVAPEENLSRFAASTGFDLRQIPEAAVASYGGDAESSFYLIRHNVDPASVERLFRVRLVAGEHRSLDRPDLVRLSGKIGTTPAGLALLGREVAGFQLGGNPARGPARIAAAYAAERLKKSPTALAEDPLRAMSAHLGSAPLRAFAVGPFEGELARGARGLLAGATAIGAAARPSAREGILVAVAVGGDFSKSGEAASHELRAAWNDLASGSLGRLLGLDQPIEPPLATHGNDAVAVAVEINPQRLARGLHAATGATLAELMR